jgi:hypothetical protein
MTALNIFVDKSGYTSASLRQYAQKFSHQDKDRWFSGFSVYVVFELMPIHFPEMPLLIPLYQRAYM